MTSLADAPPSAPCSPAAPAPERGDTRWRRSRALPALLRATVFAAVLAGCGTALLAFGKSLPLAAACFALGPLAILCLGLDRLARRHRVCDDLLTVESGLFVRRRAELALRQVRGVATNVGPLQRLCGCGDVLVIAPGAGHMLGAMIVSQADHDRLWLHDVPDCEPLAAGLRAHLQAT